MKSFIIILMVVCLSVAWAQDSHPQKTEFIGQLDSFISKVNTIDSTILDTTFRTTVVDQLSGMDTEGTGFHYEDRTRDIEVPVTRQVVDENGQGVVDENDQPVMETVMVPDTETYQVKVWNYVTEGNSSNNVYDPTSYMGKLLTAVDEINALVNTYENQGDLKKQYLQEVADIFVKEYAIDLGTVSTDISEKTYTDDLARVQERLESNLDTRNTQRTEQDVVFDPKEFLDRNIASARRSGKIELEWAGVNDHWLGQDIAAVIDAFMTHFGGDQVAMVDLAFLKKSWGTGTEVYGMNTAYDEQIYNDWGVRSVNDYSGSDAWKLARAQQDGDYNESFVIDEYGSQVDPNSDDYAQYNETISDNEKRYARIGYKGGDGVYNNRRYGYKYKNKTATTIRITTNGREYALQEDVFTSPLVLDMDGDGKIQASKGYWLPHSYSGAKMAEFDMDGDGFLDITEWVGPNDGLLIAYNGGKEVSANDLFGTAGGFYHGYEKLSLYDKNNDGKISGEELEELSVWQDKNGNALVDSGEVQSLKALEITSISVKHDFRMVSSFEQNGISKKVWDWYPLMQRVKRKK